MNPRNLPRLRYRRPARHRPLGGLSEAITLEAQTGLGDAYQARVHLHLGDSGKTAR